jgi:hypothetical protein
MLAFAGRESSRIARTSTYSGLRRRGHAMILPAGEAPITLVAGSGHTIAMIKDDRDVFISGQKLFATPQCDRMMVNRFDRQKEIYEDTANRRSSFQRRVLSEIEEWSLRKVGRDQTRIESFDCRSVTAEQVSASRGRVFNRRCWKEDHFLSD